MKKRIVSIIMAMVLGFLPAAGALAEESVMDVLPVEESMSIVSIDGTGEAEIEITGGDTPGDTSEPQALGAAADETETAAQDVPDAQDSGFDAIIAEGEPDTVEDASGGVLDEMSGDAAGTDGTASADGLSDISYDDFLTGVEEVETKYYTADAGTEMIVEGPFTETLSEAGYAANASPGRQKFRSVTEYTDSYGAQLEENAKAVYDALVEKYVTERGSGDITLSLSIEFTSSNYTGDINKWNKETDTGYQGALPALKYSVQAAYDAFAYDYPEVFWMTSCSYSWKIGFGSETDNNGNYIGKIFNVTFQPQELYVGASGEIGAFDAAVRTVADEIKSSLGEDLPDYYTIVKAIHDYLCNTVTYNENTYAHSAVGVFLKDKIVVCEGYAKAFKVLCNEFGIDSVLVVGDAGGAHMWNYVKMEDGKWYLVDTTWDDSESGVSYKYFLIGSNSKDDSGILITAGRQPYANFSNSTNTQDFVYPVLNGDAYRIISCTHEWTENENERVDASCKTKTNGYYIYTCKNCTSITKKVIRYMHDWGEYQSNDDATCQHDGTKTAACTECGTQNTVTDPGTQTAHSFKTYVYNNDATCQRDGTTTAFCEYGCGTKDTRTAAGTKTDHSYAAYTYNNDATCQHDGTMTASCIYGCGTTNTVTAAGTKVGHSYAAYVYNNDATCLTNGTKTASCIYGCGTTSTITAAGTAKGHSFTSYVSNGDATALKDGTKTAKCAHGCGATSTVTDAGSRLTPTMKLTATSIKLKKGQSTTAVKVSGLAKGDSVKSWSSSKTSIVKVTQSGKITAKKKTGKAVVTVTLASGLSRNISVKVQSGAVKTTKVSGIPKSLKLKKGKKARLSPVITPITSAEKVTYTSSNKKVATVSAKGVITAKSSGKAKITVKSGSKKATVTVTVPKTATQAIKNVPAALTLKKGKTKTLKPKLSPASSEDKITYTSSNKKVATVSAKGKITAKKKGTTVITVKSGKIKVKCKVTVK